MSIRHTIGWAIISVFALAAIVAMIAVFFTEYDREERIEILKGFAILLAMGAVLAFAVLLVVA